VECPDCKGDGRVLSVETIAMKIARKLGKMLREAPNNSYLVQVHPAVAELIEDHSKEQSPFTLLMRYNSQIYLRANAGLHMEEYDIEPIHGKADITKLDGARLYH
jgi:Ribonuclease G/E